MPRPQGPLRIVEGAEYDAARAAADKANRVIRREQGLVGQPVDVHEIQPVKFGGSPTNPTNYQRITVNYGDSLLNALNWSLPVTSSTTGVYKNNAFQSTNSTTTSYLWYDGAVQGITVPVELRCQFTKYTYYAAPGAPLLLGTLKAAPLSYKLRRMLCERRSF